MIMIFVEFATVLIGIAVTAVLFYRFPKLPGMGNEPDDFPNVSVIIPARNEENNLPLLLMDLGAQTLPLYEIICVDDASEDATGKIAASFGAKLISLNTKPEGWMGKSWACQKGADAATGELLLFLDADVRLGREGVRKLMRAYSEESCTISVQPYHRTEKLFEQLSMMFNLVQIAANGAALPRPLNVGLYGPVILITQPDYKKIGGHESVRKSIVEDMALGLRLKKEGLPYRLFVGDQDIAFRMYGDGLISLLQGWIKNMAAGAAKTPIPVFMMVFVWITSLISVPLHIIKSAVSANIPWLIVYSLLYIVWVFILSFLAKKVGRFQAWAYIFYPVLLLVLVGVVFVSVFKKLFGLKVTWKGRAVKTGEKT